MSIFAIFRSRSLPIPGGAYTLALLLVALTLALRFLVSPNFETPILVLFVPAILVTSCVGGFWPGLFAAVAACVSCDYLIIAPAYSFRATPQSVVTDLGSLLATGFVIAAVCEVLRTAIQQSEAAKAELEKAHQSSKQLAAIVEGSGDAIIGMNLDGVITSWNKSSETIFGYGTAEAVGSHISMLIPPDLQTEEDGILAETRAGRIVSSFETRRVRKDGTLVDVSLTVSPIRDARGAVVGASKTMRDISERKRAEAGLRASEERLKLALDAAKMGTWEWQMRQSQAIWSAQMYHLLGLPEGSGKESPEKFTSCIHPDDAERFQETLASLTGNEWRHDFRIIRADGKVRWLIGVGRLRRGADGQPETMYGVNYDVTELKIAEAEAKASADKLSAAMASMTDAIFIVDSNGHFVHVNDAFAAFHRFPRVEDCLKTLDEYLALIELFTIDGQAVPFEDWPLNRVLRGESDADVELVLRRRDTGESWTGSYNFAPIRDQSGNITGAVGTARDITERKQNEARFQSMREDLYHVGRLGELAQISAGIAHELNQPLAAMFNYATAAKRLIAKPEPQSLESAREAISKAAEQAVRAGEIIRRMRSFVEKGERNRQLEDINAIAEDAAALALIGAKAANITTHMDLAPGLPSISVDRLQIQQVLINLLGNAVEAMADVPRRELTLSTRVTEGGFVEVVVSDTGCGIPKDVLERLFMPFITTKTGGMGIGLVISQTIVEAHGGRIFVSSQQGVGTTFRFRLPAAQDQIRPNAA